MRKYRLSTRGELPVAHEFCVAGSPGWRGSEFSPVSPECPMAMRPRTGPVPGVELGLGLVDVIGVEVFEEAASVPPLPPPHPADASTTAATVVAQIRPAAIGIPVHRTSVHILDRTTAARYGPGGPAWHHPAHRTSDYRGQRRPRRR